MTAFHQKCLTPFFIFYLVLFWIVKDLPFFWDTVQLSSKQAHWFYENDFKYFFLPREIDSGHPPFFGFALAVLWKMLGKSLWVGHLAMLLFLWGIVIVVFQLGNYFLGEKYAWIVLLVFVVDPFFAGQSILVSPDISVIFFWLLGILAIIKQKNVILLFAALGLAMISLRGMMLVVGLYLFCLTKYIFEDSNKLSLKVIFQKILPFIPSGLFGLIFLGLHYYHTGWIGYHDQSPWASTFEKAEFPRMIYNIGIISWRVLDFGRVFVWGAIFISIIHHFRNEIKLTVKGKELIVLLLLMVLVLTPSMIIHKSINTHRYLLPIVLLINFTGLYFVVKSRFSVKIKTLLFTIIFLGLVTGNFWVYPKKIAQGWDATLAHWPYYKLRQEMIDFIDAENIPIAKVGTVFPNVGPFKFIELSTREGGFPLVDFEQHEYVFYSNVFNDFTDEQIDALASSWIPVKEFSDFQICVILYQKKI